MKKRYYANANSPFTDKDAETIGKWLDSEFPDGEITPKQVVALAKNRRCPVHKYFDWDDAVAAEKHRLHQARQIINCVVVIVDDSPVRAYHNVYVESLKANAYEPLTKASQSKDLWDQVLQKAWLEIQGWKNRYKAYQQFTPIHTAIEHVERTMNEKDSERNPNSRTRKRKSANYVSRRLASAG